MSIRSPSADLWAAIGSDVSQLRIGVARAYFFDDLDPEFAAAVEEAVAVLGRLGRSVQEVQVPLVDTYAVLAAEIYAYHAELVADSERRKLYQPITLDRILSGAEISLPTYVENRRELHIARHTADDIFAEVDVLVTPTAMIGPARVDAETATLKDVQLIRNTLPFNVRGVPTISVPCGFTQAGLPIGLQISGRRLDEVNVLALAHAYERATDWHSRRPRAV